MGYSVFPAPSSGITVSDGNTAGWNRTNPAGLTLVASTGFGSLTGTSTYTISGLSGYSFYRLIVTGYYNNVPLLMRLNGNSEARYDSQGFLSTTNSWVQRRESGWNINYSNGAEFNHTVLEIDDANSANYKQTTWKGITRGAIFTDATGLWTKNEALSSITLLVTGGGNFVNAGYDGNGILLYGGY